MGVKVYIWKKFYKDNCGCNFKSFLSNQNEDNKVNVIYTFIERNNIIFNENDFSGLFRLNNTIILDLKNKNKSIIEDVNKFL